MVRGASKAFRPFRAFSSKQKWTFIDPAANEKFSLNWSRQIAPSSRSASAFSTAHSPAASTATVDAVGRIFR
ncbi:MAG: hypothetical protein ACI9LX_002394 [Paraglaciecola sp.]|jgi:hypothetical protein